MSAFELSKASLEDISACVDVLFDTFTSDWLRDTFTGPDTPQWRAHATKSYQHINRTLPGDYWIKVTEAATGRVIGFSDWRIHPNVVPPHDRDKSVPWFADNPEKKAEVVKRLREIEDVRRQYITEPYIQPTIFVVHPDYWRRGAGTMMMRWGCELADHLFLPMWVQATPAGSRLYAVFDCQPLPEERAGGGKLLRREPKADAIPGGKSEGAAKVEGQGMNQISSTSRPQ